MATEKVKKDLSAISEKWHGVRHCWLLFVGSINLLNDVCIAQRQGICSCKVRKLSCDCELVARLRGQGRGGKTLRPQLKMNDGLGWKIDIRFRDDIRERVIWIIIVAGISQQRLLQFSALRVY